MEYCLIPFQFSHVPILYPLKTMFSGGIKSEHSQKMCYKSNITLQLYKCIERV